jgi:hypothetical protein
MCGRHAWLAFRLLVGGLALPLALESILGSRKSLE